MNFLKECYHLKNRKNQPCNHEWLENNKSDNQDHLVNVIMEQLETSPLDWHIYFEQLTNEGKITLFPTLKQFMEKMKERMNIM